MKPLRLLYIVREPYPSFRSDVVTLFGKYLPRLGIHSDYVAELEPEIHTVASWGGGRQLLCDGAGSPLVRQWRKAVHGIRLMIRASSSVYDAIQVRDMAITAFVALIIGRLRGIPVFFWMSFPMCDAQIQRALSKSRWGAGFWFPFLQGAIGRVLLNRVILKHVDHVFAQSDYMRKRLLDGGVPACNVTAVPMGVDMEAIAQVWNGAQRQARQESTQVIAHLGVLEAGRGSAILVEVLALVREQWPEARLLCIGSCESAAFQAVLDARIRSQGLEGAIHVTGWVPRAEAWRLAGEADVGLCLIPSGPLYDVASPTKLVECLALGLPMVVNEHPDQRQVIEGSGAGYVVEWSAREIAAAISRLLGDTKSRNAMSARGPEYVARNRSYEQIARMVADRYAGMLRGPDPTPAVAE